jgi:ABC-type lipoprotein release transport system permease subunit
MQIPVLKGRGFELSDVTGPPAALVNETLAKKFFTDRDPIGGHVKPGGPPNTPWLTIVGVVKDVKSGGVAEAAGTELYMLADQMPRVLNFAPGAMNFVIRSAVPFDRLAGEYRRVVREADATLPIINIREMDTVIGDAIARPRFLATLLAILAGLALALAVVGTYGILAYLVAERRQEIGIRMALGADRSKILSLVLGRGLMLSVAGLIVGLAASLALTRLLRTMLFNVTPTDPLTLTSVAGVMIVAALVACIVPAWRATRVDPNATLRQA